MTAPASARRSAGSMAVIPLGSSGASGGSGASVTDVMPAFCPHSDAPARNARPGPPCPGAAEVGRRGPAVCAEPGPARGNRFRRTGPEAIGSTHGTHCLALPQTEPIASPPWPSPTRGNRFRPAQGRATRGNRFRRTEPEAIGSTHGTHCLALPRTEPIASPSPTRGNRFTRRKAERPEAIGSAEPGPRQSVPPTEPIASTSRERNPLPRHQAPPHHPATQAGTARRRRGQTGTVTVSRPERRIVPGVAPVALPSSTVATPPT